MGIRARCIFGGHGGRWRQRARAISYFHNGQMHDFVPDYLVRLGKNGDEVGTLILEVKGYDERAEVKTAAAKRWCAAVNADQRFGRWHFCMVQNPAETSESISNAMEALADWQAELQRSG
jgi:type III restriction enzyme